MEQIFKDRIGLELEVYIDDIVAKSTNSKQHCNVLARVFDVLRKHKLKLNLEKCSFGVQVGKFLVFMLTRRGIEANPNKCEVVINIRSPRSVKEVQQLAS
ncbi:Retrovirus-related Pol polyprotein from transposon 17.6, partial [Mucuna pruriens]